MAEEMTRESVGVGEHEEWDRIWADLTDDDLLQYKRRRDRGHIFNLLTAATSKTSGVCLGRDATPNVWK